MTAPLLHPLDPLTPGETTAARDLVVALNPGAVIFFRLIYLEEPPKKDLVRYLEDEHAGKTPQPLPRLAIVIYDLVAADGVPEYSESIVDLTSGKIISHAVVPEQQHAALTLPEFDELIKACNTSSLFQDALKEYPLPDGFEAVIEPWPYGGMDPAEENRRFFQGLVFGRDTRPGNDDTNFYPFPIPLIPVMDYVTKEIIRVERLATGGKGDALDAHRKAKDGPLAHCKAHEYVPELLKEAPRTDLKPLNVMQPEGPSFSVAGNLVEWQGWRFRVGFNPREGATLHDLWFKDRSVMHRLAISEMTVPYADPRSSYPRKQAFDFGDGGAGICANNLQLGCDCLGVIQYFGSLATDPQGTPQPAPNVVCLHEQDNGILWKHTNWRTGRAVVTRLRELVVQFIITLANYEYIFAFKLDQAGGITVETRATGIVSIVNIDPGKQSDYGTVVGPGALAQNHQHIFCIRMDPAVDGNQNTVVVEESHPVKMNPKTNPSGNYYEVKKTPVTKPGHFDARGDLNRVIKMVNTSKTNPISGNPVGYKFTPAGTQLLLADPDSVQARRAQFAQHHVWVTKHKDGEFYAAGRYTLQSSKEIGGVADAVKRDEQLEDEDVVVWNVFGLTHNPRVEDFPVMPVEIHQLHIKPVDFFTENPAINIPASKNSQSILADRSRTEATASTNGVNGTNGHACCN